jgi:hypothetical protein
MRDGPPGRPLDLFRHGNRVDFALYAKSGEQHLLLELTESLPGHVRQY